MLPLLARKILPEPVVDNLRSSAAVYRLRNGSPPQMTAGVGCGLLFDPGPSNRAYASGDNELPVQNAIAACLKPGGVFYDIGANVGFFTVIAAKLVGSTGLVHAFEPVPENAVYVRLNVHLNGFRNVVVTPKAVSSAPGTADFWTAEYSGGGALATATAPPDAGKMIRVEVVSIDDLVFGSKWTPPTVVKVDVEGAEIDVLRGMERTLREIQPIVVFEIDDGDREAFESKYKVCENFLSMAGYDVERLENCYTGNAWIVGHGLAKPRGTK